MAEIERYTLDEFLTEESLEIRRLSELYTVDEVGCVYEPAADEQLSEMNEQLMTQVSGIIPDAVKALGYSRINVRAILDDWRDNDDYFIKPSDMYISLSINLHREMPHDVKRYRWYYDIHFSVYYESSNESYAIRVDTDSSAYFPMDSTDGGDIRIPADYYSAVGVLLSDKDFCLALQRLMADNYKQITKIMVRHAALRYMSDEDCYL